MFIDKRLMIYKAAIKLHFMKYLFKKRECSLCYYEIIFKIHYVKKDTLCAQLFEMQNKYVTLY